MEEEALSARLTTQEKLLLSQAVYKLGALDWDKISGLLANHPVLEGRPAEWFDTKSCEAYYVGLMTEVGINVPAQDAARPQAKVHLRLAQNFYSARLQELKSSIAEYEQKFTTLMAEIAAIKSGSMDKSIKDEIRASLARRFGKKLLDSWVPDEEAVKEAIAAGPPSEEEPKQGEPEPKQSEPEPKQSDPVTSEPVPAEEPVAPLGEVAENGQTDAKGEEEPKVTEDVEMAEPSAKTPTVSTEPVPPVADARGEPTVEKEQPAIPSSPASELSSAPDDSTKPATPVKPVPTVDEEGETTAAAASTRASKRKASTQPRGGQPASKRSVRRKTSASPATPAPVPAEAEAEENEQGAEGEQAAEESKRPEDEPIAEPEPPVPDEPTPTPAVETEAEPAAETKEEEAPVTRGRRTSKRESIAGSRAKRGTSPASSPSKHMSPPPSARRAPSASSAKSGTSTPAPAEERRSARRAQPKGRGMRDEVVSKSVREQSAAVESVKEEEEAAEAEAEEHQEPEQEQEQEQERPPTRSSRRGVKEDSAPNAPVPDLSAPLPDQRKGTRRSSTRGGGVQPAETPDEDKPAVEAEPEEKEKKQAKRPRHSSPRESKAAQRMLNGLLDQIAGHRNGNVFAQPVKKSEAPDYHEVIKRPMDLKTIRSRIRDGHITTIDEFERDAMLIFANATMFNPKGSAIHGMALDMMKDAEQHIQHLKDVQKRIAR